MEPIIKAAQEDARKKLNVGWEGPSEDTINAVVSSLTHSVAEAVRKEERGRIKQHISEWDILSLLDAEFAGNVRHYFREIIASPYPREVIINNPQPI